jgi:cell division protein FtsI (penicillin-binding protein 3)
MRVLKSQPTGETVVLTIDQAIQYQTERALQSAVERTHAKSGSVIVLDPRSGEILALANAPSFDPNNVSASPADNRRNWALQNIYEPDRPSRSLLLCSDRKKLANR